MKKILLGSMALMAFASGCGSSSNAPQPAIVGGGSGVVTSTSTIFNCPSGGITFGSGACLPDITSACNAVSGAIGTLNGTTVCQFNILDEGNYYNSTSQIDLYASESGIYYNGLNAYGMQDPTTWGETLNVQVKPNDEIVVTGASGGWNVTSYHSSGFNFNFNFSWDNSAPSCSNANNIANGGLYGEVVSSPISGASIVGSPFALDGSGNTGSYVSSAGYLRLGLDVPGQSGAVSICSNAQVTIKVLRCEDASGNTYQCD